MAKKTDAAPAAQPPAAPPPAADPVAVTQTATQRLDEHGQPIEPPPGHGGRPQVE